MQMTASDRQDRFPTTIELLARAAEKYPDKVALRIFRSQRYDETTFGQFQARVDQLAAGLIALGISPKDKVSVLGENRPEWCIAYLAAQKAGAIAVPLDSLQKQAEFRHIIQDAGVRAVIASERFVGDMLEVRDSVTKPEFIISMDDEGREGVLSMSTVTGPTPEAWPPVATDDLAVIIYTSGTTGQSKGVMLTQKNITSDAVLCGGAIDYGTADSFISVLPLHHTFECTGGFLVPLCKACTITYARSLKSRDIIEDIKNSGATIMLGVPLLFEKMMQGIQRKLSQAPATKRALVSTLFGAERFGRKVGMELGGKLFGSLRTKAGLETLRLMVAGGAALPPYVAEWFSSLGFLLIQGYGLTETSPVTNINRVGMINHASVGPPIPGCEIRIADPGPEGHGEVCVKGSMVMKGYYKNPDATRQIFDEGGWLHTGDIGYTDHLNRLYITGRRKNVIVTTAGKNVYPEEVEDQINQSPFVLESLVIGRPLPGTTSEEVYAMVVPNYEHFEEEGAMRGQPYSAEEIQSVVTAAVKSGLANLADYKRPKQFEIRDEEFEKTSTKKIKRFLYKQRGIPV